MENGYKLFKQQNLVTVKYWYLLKLLKKDLNQIIDELKWVAFHSESVLINDSQKGILVIYSQTDYSALPVLLTYLERQLLLDL